MGVSEGRRVAVMQPYLFPYAGYYRLLAVVDCFVIFDCVQFPRRGRVHRCQVPGPSGEIEWLTLPLEPARRGSPIQALRFAREARAEFDRRLKRLVWIQNARGENADRVREWLNHPFDNLMLTDYLEYTLRETAALLGLNRTILRSSSLGLDPELRAQERVIAAVQAVGGDEYVNAPGGRDLYDSTVFADAGLRLSFLSPYQGQIFYLLPALLERPSDDIATDIQETTRLVESD